MKKTVNQDDPTVYHLFYADELGSAGSDITFFEYPGAPPGAAGAGMVHRVVWRVASGEALDFWERRLRDEGTDAARDGSTLTFKDPEGLEHALVLDQSGDPPLRAETPGIPSEHALRGFAGVRAFTRDAPQSERFLEDALEFEPRGEDAWEARGGQRGGFYAYDRAERLGRPGAGTVHHVAWASTMDDHETWRERVAKAGGSPTPVIDRFYFRSIYFREPSGVLFEIATLGPGFTSDEPLKTLGEALSLPPDFEHLRDRLEPELTPLPDPRATPSAT